MTDLFSIAGKTAVVTGGSRGIGLMIVGGVAVLALFVLWQTRAPEPLIPLALFRDRNFSLANVAITTLGLSVTQTRRILAYRERIGGLRSPPPAAPPPTSRTTPATRPQRNGRWRRRLGRLRPDLDDRPRRCRPGRVGRRR